jgi:ubiquinone/menaquinone biosynthesis C-methylase UbiE
VKQEVELRRTFDQVATDYDRVRPGYPVDLVDDIVSRSALSSGARILEIGCGTGLATLPFAERGFTMLCLDIGEHLVALSKNKFRDFPNVEIKLSSFEEWSSPENRFDLIMSASAFHWVDPDVGYSKIFQLLQPSGSVAIFTHYHPPPFEGFFDEVQNIYQRIVSEWEDPRSNPPLDEFIEERRKAIDQSALFQPVTVRKYPWSKEFTTDEYIMLLNTFSGHRALEDDRREVLFSSIADLIDQEYGGRITRPYLTTLYHAEKVN